MIGKTTQNSITVLLLSTPVLDGGDVGIDVFDVVWAAGESLFNGLVETGLYGGVAVGGPICMVVRLPLIGLAELIHLPGAKLCHRHPTVMVSLQQTILLTIQQNCFETRMRLVRLGRSLHHFQVVLQTIVHKAMPK